jgi:beta-glucanase (GH16 family)
MTKLMVTETSALPANGPASAATRSVTSAGTCNVGGVRDRADRVLDELPGSVLAWSDEFDGPAGSPPSPGVWQPQAGGHGWGNRELQYYTGGTENASLDGAGRLVITVDRTPAQDRARRDGCGYTSARLTSKDRMAVRYGVVQARMQIPEGQGMWPAFWMMGQDFDEAGWPRCGEIDVMENFGKDPRIVHGAAHGPGYTGSAVTSSHRALKSLAGGFHVYSVLWEPGRIRWYLDDRHYGTVTPADLGGQPWVFDHDFFLVLNVAVGGSASVTPGPVRFPQRLLVDYVRLYTTPREQR